MHQIGVVSDTIFRGGQDFCQVTLGLDCLQSGFTETI